jgi:hypothetical protein
VTWAVDAESLSQFQSRNRSRFQKHGTTAVSSPLGVTHKIVTCAVASRDSPSASQPATVPDVAARQARFLAQLQGSESARRLAEKTFIQCPSDFDSKTTGNKTETDRPSHKETARRFKFNRNSSQTLGGQSLARTERANTWWMLVTRPKIRESGGGGGSGGSRFSARAVKLARRLGLAQSVGPVESTASRTGSGR